MNQWFTEETICLKYCDDAIGIAPLVEPAFPDVYPDSPQWTKTLLLAAAGGFVAGLAFYLFGYALRRKSLREKSAQPGP